MDVHILAIQFPYLKDYIKADFVLQCKMWIFTADFNEFARLLLHFLRFCCQTRHGAQHKNRGASLRRLLAGISRAARPAGDGGETAEKGARPRGYDKKPLPFREAVLAERAYFVTQLPVARQVR